MFEYGDVYFERDSRSLIQFGSLHLTEGIHLLYGVSGSGKSTLLNLLGAREAHQGWVKHEGQTYDLRGLEAREEFFLKHVGIQFQDANLIEEMNGWENLLFGQRILGRQTIDKDRMNDLLETLQIFNILDKKVSKLSRGEQQRISIARALIYETKLILLDEPFVFLQKELILTLYSYIAGLIRDLKRVCVLSSHDPLVIQHGSFDSVLHCDDGFFGRVEKSMID